MRKQHFHNNLRRAAPKNGRPLWLDKRLPYYKDVKIFVIQGVFFYNFNLKIGRSRFLLPFLLMSLVWGFEYTILAQIQNSNHQQWAVILNAWRCLIAFCIYVYFSCHMVAATPWLCVLVILTISYRTISPERYFVPYPLDKFDF